MLGSRPKWGNQHAKTTKWNNVWNSNVNFKTPCDQQASSSLVFAADGTYACLLLTPSFPIVSLRGQHKQRQSSRACERLVYRVHAYPPRVKQLFLPLANLEAGGVQRGTDQSIDPWTNLSAWPCCFTFSSPSRPGPHLFVIHPSPFAHAQPPDLGSRADPIS